MSDRPWLPDSATIPTMSDDQLRALLDGVQMLIEMIQEERAIRRARGKE